VKSIISTRGNAVMNTTPPTSAVTGRQTTNATLSVISFAQLMRLRGLGRGWPAAPIENASVAMNATIARKPVNSCVCPRVSAAMTTQHVVDAAASTAEIRKPMTHLFAAWVA